MKIVIVTQEDPFYIPLFFKEMFATINNKNIIVDGVLVQNQFGDSSTIKTAKRMIVFFGWYHFIKKCSKYLMIKVADKLFNWKFIKTPITIKAHVLANHIRVLQFASVNNLDFINYLKENNIDLVVSISASEIFKSRVLKAPRYGCINFHNAPLPKYKGMMPNFWQMLYDEPFSVLTVHEMVRKLDNGRIIYQDKTPISKCMTLEELIIKSKIKSVSAFYKVIEMFETNQVIYQEINNQDESYFTFPTKKDIAEFKRKGKRII